jgi:hypothetical protein
MNPILIRRFAWRPGYWLAVRLWAGHSPSPG